MNKQVKTYITLILNAFLSGVMISVGGAVYLLCENKIVGSFLFSFGLFTIVQRGFALYTGKVGYIPENSPIYILETLITLIGNTFGTAFGAFLLQQTRFADSLREKCIASMELKTGDSIISQLILGAFCGMLMYTAVWSFRERKTPLGILFCIPVFVRSGFEHSIADIFYFATSGIVSLQAFVFLWTVIAGNAVGAVILPLLNYKKAGEAQA